jgi:acyl-CoA synthetase (AMP-forming)/AMP-acid ligase II
MLISGGENVYPAEIEKLLAGHPDIADIGVIGRADAQWGEVPVAFVVAREGKTLTAEALTQYCGGRIAKYKTPKDFYFRTALPRNAAGKLVKAELKAELKKTTTK